MAERLVLARAAMEAQAVPDAAVRRGSQPADPSARRTGQLRPDHEFSARCG
jgi:hypothetical protein